MRVSAQAAELPCILLRPRQVRPRASFFVHSMIAALQAYALP